MCLITISLLLFSNLFISITDAEKPRRRFNSDHGDCVCFPEGQSLIPELMNPELHGLERLVVYLYRVVKTNQIILHKPGPGKQALVPNIPFTEGDILKVVTADTVGSLFNNYPYNDHADPIGLNIGTIHNVGPKPNFNESPFVSKPNDVLHPSIPSPIWNYLDQSPQPSSPWYQTKGKLIYPQRYQEPNLFLNNGQPQPNYVEFNNQPNPVNPIPKIPIIANTANIWDADDKKLFVPVSLNQPNPELQLLQPDVVKLLKYNEGEPASRWPQPNLTFDNWFNKQIELLHNPQLTQDIRAINNDELRKLVLKTLFENHMLIGAAGIMIDENGTPINLEHLELRPILIGDPVKLQTLQGNQQLTLPRRKPYFEGLLITFDNPLKILGVIPLGKTYVSSQEQIVQTPISPSMKHYQTPSGLTNNSRSEEGPKEKKEEAQTNKDVKIPKAEESAKPSESANTSTLLEIPGFLKTEASSGLPKEIVVPKPLGTLEEPKTSKPSFESNTVSQSRNAHRRLYNSNFNTPFSSPAVDYYQSAGNEYSLYPKPHDIEPLQLIQRPINVNIGTHDSSSGSQLTDTEFTVKSDSHLVVTPLDGQSESYLDSIVESSSPQLIATELADNPNSHLIITPLGGNSETYSNSAADSSIPQSTVSKFTGKSDYHLTITPLDGEPGNYLNPNLIVKPINYHPLSSNQFLEPHSFSPKLTHPIAHPFDNKLDFKFNPGSSIQNGHIGHISSSQLTVSPYNTKTDSNWNSDSNSAWAFYPNYNEPKNTNWQQTANSNQLPSIYHEIGGFKSPLPYSHVTRAENQITTPPDDEIPSWINRKNEETTQKPVVPDPKKPTPQETISHNFGDSQIQNEVVSDSGNLTRKLSKPFFQDVFQTFIQMVLNNLIVGRSKNTVHYDDENTVQYGDENTVQYGDENTVQYGDENTVQYGDENTVQYGNENTVQYDDENNVSDVNIKVNSTSHNHKTRVAEDLDGPDFRIIGGSAATGSGSPLNNKGRSGLLVN